MWTSESCGNSHDAQPSIYRHVKGLFSLPQQKQPSLSKPRSLPSIVAQFIGLPICHCAERSDEAISWRGMRLPRTFQVLAMTKSEALDESSNYKDQEVKYEDNT